MNQKTAKSLRRLTRLQYASKSKAEQRKKYQQIKRAWNATPSPKRHGIIEVLEHYANLSKQPVPPEQIPF